MSCWTKEELENMLEDVVNELNLSDEYLYKALDELYHSGWHDRNKGRDYDPRGTTQWQDVLDLFRLQKMQCRIAKTHNQ